MILGLLYLGAYLLGSVSFAVLFGHLKGVNILEVGSGNPGMTNVIRALGPGLGHRLLRSRRSEGPYSRNDRASFH